MVYGLDIVVCGFVPRQVGNGFDVARLHVHQHRSRPFRFLLDTHIVKLRFEDVLNLHVDSGQNVVSVDGGDVLPLLYRSGQLYLLLDARLAV